ncbi:hepatic leukemia factor isoform X3 [Colias croceus]|uniref:hepatic leukemia factor isoform X3 n=1 Tax=Colias crocea TaxID=72248 RepID=UPI001E27E990|nr:hepatic leukemia factor isoform X3 [Colias croceus]
MEYQPQPVAPLGPPPPPQLLPPPQPLPSLPQLQHAHVPDDDRWSQYHIWRQHVFVNGKSVNSKDVLEDKKDDNELWEAQAAFLGPNLWDKTLPYDPDLKVQEYVDLDEFLSENGMPGEGLGGGHLGGSAFGPAAGLALGLQAPVTKRERSPSPSDCMSPDTINPPLSPADSTFSMASSGRDFDPRTRAFSDEELKPQPMIKKSRKQVHGLKHTGRRDSAAAPRLPQILCHTALASHEGGMSVWRGVLTPYRRRRQFVPDDLKDDKYWARRRKNNMAAKRSRDARRMKENQIALRAGYLEKENMGLRQEVELLKKENHILREKLSKYADV